ncbi:unnamed protein product [Sphenostylis stenocarpa]|uniref:Uncharacterized protein n=1 Tax=Sphenostylis stenocarpa TaxID=92480 RepID=A0AA86RPE4_9FABA|nr:unnamed protein product [Sphenostylis stenocarpa]
MEFMRVWVDCPIYFGTVSRTAPTKDTIWLYRLVVTHLKKVNWFMVPRAIWIENDLHDKIPFKTYYHILLDLMS